MKNGSEGIPVTLDQVLGWQEVRRKVETYKIRLRNLKTKQTVLYATKSDILLQIAPLRSSH